MLNQSQNQYARSIASEQAATSLNTRYGDTCESIASSPIDQKIRELGAALECAHQGLVLLNAQLLPIRDRHSVGSYGASDCDKRPTEACEIEERLMNLITGAARLSEGLSILRGELRI